MTKTMHQKRKERLSKSLEKQSAPSVVKTNINWYPGHMNKAKREINEKLSLVDIVIILLDARAPRSSFNPDFMELFKNKPQLFLLNKASLADKIETKKWLKYYNGQNKLSLDIDAISGYNLNKIVSSCFELMKKQDKKKDKKIIRALICGIPNIGKSTLINKLTSKKKAKTGDKPGVTKALQWVKVNDEVFLLDTPGILWPKFENEEVGFHLALINSIKEEILPINEVINYAVDFYLKYYKNEFLTRYKLNNLDNIDSKDDLLLEIGKKRGCINKEGVDLERTLMVILNDIKNNKIGKITYDRLI